MLGTVHGSGKTGKYIAVFLPLCAKVIAREKHITANKVKCVLEMLKYRH